MGAARGWFAFPGARRGRRPQSVRWRLTLLYGGLFVVTGAVLLALTYALVAEDQSLAVSGSGSGERPTPGGADTGDAGSGPVVKPGAGAGKAAVESYVRERLAVQRDDQLHQLLIESGIALGIMVIASLVLGWLVAGRVLAPLRDMAVAARRISADDLHRRLAVSGPDDELKDLADTFDDLLARLEGAFEAQRRFVANASHELRTPLTLQQAVIDVALADPRADAASLRAACLRVRAAGQEQERLIEALLTLARGQRAEPARESVDLAVLAGELLPEGGAGAGAEAGAGAGARTGAGGRLRPRVDAELGSAPLVGDPHLVGRLVSNLLENAVRHNVPEGEGGWVTVWTGVVDGRASLRIANSGPVVPVDQVGVLFEPFRRLGVERVRGRARARVREGAGLGLSIVAAIVGAHGGVVEARARGEGGLWVEVMFPPPPPLPVPVHDSGALPPNPRSSNAGRAEMSPDRRIPAGRPADTSSPSGV
ncbi:sensor histidine kinase [Streptomyces dioscori]|uniref:histidine kinase n=1 Tax=Streptomyces dioscori TaxID=2109333 RepID=A0A2P8PVH2_9ACTN|nr:HAMP domain-containing sensor histidine kinase [Streptomyces dioscori]PSM37989.1 sensor histidine kinase [Streptomyces dioscori]